MLDYINFMKMTQNYIVITSLHIARYLPGPLLTAIASTSYSVIFYTVFF